MRNCHFLLFFLGFYFFLITSTCAQAGFGNNSPVSCGTDELNKELLQTDSLITYINTQIELRLLHYKKPMQRPLSPVSTLILPVVVHVIHNNGPENISDTRVQAGIQHLNEAFANSGYYDPASGVNTNIQFCLAQRDPNGGGTTGITRDVSALTNMAGPNYYSDDIKLKDINRWNPNCYINIWLVNDIPGPVAGYAYLPASHGTNMDGILMEASYLGSGYSNDVVVIHEMGHYLGLYHTFEQGCTNNNCTTEGDKVCDTPPDNSTSVTSCNLTVNSCSTDVLSGFSTDEDDLTQDYLDYGNWDCMSVFTQGQADRMYWFILNVRNSLLNCKSCLTPCSALVTANFITSAHVAAPGTNIFFTNTSLNGTSWSWYINGILVSNAFSYNQSFSQQGTYIIKVVVESGDPAFCVTREKIDSVKIICSTHASFTPGYNGVSVTGQNITFTNTSTDAISYEWFYDNRPDGTSVDYTAGFATAGMHYIKLKATSLYCSDSMSVYYLSNAPAVANFSFQKRYSIQNNGAPFRNNPCLILPDQNIIQIAGDRNLGNTILKLTGTGNTIWSKTYKSNDNPFAPNIDFKKVLFTNDGNLIFLGDINITSETGPEIMKTDLDGNIIWNRSFYEPASVFSYDILALPDGGYIISGNYYYGYLIFYKIDGNGQLLWRKTLAYNGFDFSGASLQLYNNEICIASSVNNQAGNNWDGLIMKLDPVSADILFGKRYDYNGKSNWFTKMRTAGKKLVIEGTTNSMDAALPAIKTLLTINENDIKDFKLVNFPKIDVNRFDAGLTVDAENKILLTIPESGTFASHVLVFDSALSFIKGRTYTKTAGFVPNNCAQFSNGDYLLSETTGFYNTTLVRTLPDLSIQPCNSSDFIPDIQSATLLVTDILDKLAYSANFTQTDTKADISIQNTNISSYTDCSKIIDPSCDTLACNMYFLSGPKNICHIDDTFTVVLHKDTSCSLIPAWTISGTARFDVLSETDSLIKVKIISGGDIFIKVKSMSTCRIFEDSLAVNVIFSPSTVNLGRDIRLCNASAIQLHAGRGFKSYLWQDGSVDSTFTAYLPATYFVTVIDFCGNYYSDSINITWAPDVVFDLGPDKELCAHDTATISAPPGFSNYIWSADYSLNTIYGPTIKCWPGVDTVYIVTAVKAQGCVVLDSIRIKVHSVKNIHLGSDTSFCQGGSIVLDAGNNFSSYQWNTGGYNQSLIASAAGLYSIAATDNNGCISRDTLSILNVYSNPVLNLGKDKNLCENDTIILDAGHGFKSYVWQDNSVNQTLTVRTTGQYWIKADDDNNCIATDTIAILRVIENPIINLGADTSFCYGQKIVLSPGTRFTSYTWQDSSHDQNYIASQQGTYSVTVRDVYNCSAKDTIKIIALYPGPMLNIGKDTVLCKGETVALNAGIGFAGYLWQDNSIAQFFTVNSAGYYWVSVSDASGCISIDTIEVKNQDVPIHFLSLSYGLCENEQLYIKPNRKFDSYLWSTGSTNDSIRISTSGDYWLIVKDAYGCEAKESFKVVIKTCIEAVYFPNSFSPNNDGLNETFKPTVFGNLEEYNLIIYSRYGEKVFETSDIKRGWSGIHNNYLQNTSVYVWKCYFKLKNRPKQFKKGSLFLFR